MTSKTIGILTSGGDCAGLNAVIRAVVKRAVGTYGWTVYGIHQGTAGLIKRPPEATQLKMGEGISNNILRQGGTILGSLNKGTPFRLQMPDGSVKDCSMDVLEGYHELGLDALIAVGGDGSQDIISRIRAKGEMNLITIPKTIDNDVGLTETSIGYDSAVQVATDALDHLQPTAASHNRVMVLEVMGRDAGHIALAAGISGGADVILIPEIRYNLDHIAAKIEQLREHGRNFALVIVAEAVKAEDGSTYSSTFTDGEVRLGGISHYIGDRLAEMTGAETRVTVLGHVQRGGVPTHHDRLIAAAFGVRAVDLIAEDKFDRMVAWQNREVVDVPIKDAIASYKTVDLDGTLVRTARGLGICLGDEGV